MKKYLDAAESGEVITISRGGTSFTLAADVMVDVPKIKPANPPIKQKRNKLPTPTITAVTEPIRTPQMVINATQSGNVSIPVTDRFNQGFCKTHDLPLDRFGHCMQKGCKYA